jgi:hypothetical protein
VDPIPDPLLLRKSGSAGNRTWTSLSAARNSDHYTAEAVIRAVFTSLNITSEVREKHVFKPEIRNENRVSMATFAIILYFSILLHCIVQ